MRMNKGDRTGRQRRRKEEVEEKVKDCKTQMEQWSWCVRTVQMLITMKKPCADSHLPHSSPRGTRLRRCRRHGCRCHGRRTRGQCTAPPGHHTPALSSRCSTHTLLYCTGRYRCTARDTPLQHTQHGVSQEKRAEMKWNRRNSLIKAECWEMWNQRFEELLCCHEQSTVKQTSGAG